MKKTLLILAAVAFSFSSAIAQDEGIEKTLTSNNSQAIESSSVACTGSNPDIPNSPALGTSDNYYFKKFDLADLGVEDQFHIQNFQFGIKSVSASTYPGANIPEEKVDVTVELYKTNVNTFPETWGGPEYELLVSTVYTATPEDDDSVVTVEFESPITVQADEIIIAMVGHESLYGDEPGMLFYIGGNESGDDQPSYIKSIACDIISPSLIASISDSQINIVMNLKGVEGTLGVQDFINADLTLYPNPASDQFNIASGNEVIQSVTVRDILGKTIQTIKVNGLNQDVNVSNLPKGLYLVEVELETGRAVQKLIKK